MKIAIVYSSKTGNTEELAERICQLFLKKNVMVSLFRIEQFRVRDLSQFAAIVIGTYTWGNGEIPQEMMEIYRAFETQDVKKVRTGVIGTGDSGYPKFCGAVDEFKDMLYVHTNLIATLKIEVSLQMKDIDRCSRFVTIFLDQLSRKQGIG
ncbi:flavodoxin domain-containing protein [Bacillus sp. ISL-40]|uniref:flavodoxin domain-containing protein n=1 Tax=unclassified Bacillus (in: firmicutes) TaxID=185979 RepID=UPI001BE54661|nr:MULTISPECIES: flavodoxin domain-containing protein [unclassified Bacillus (in: firmicutes)]MBT2696490.1 flavodoxin domain-containing protein [Bacillus sp. ISL-40]MBT2725180.1 flavodoxin domain-containing protein [Bacillus sp. ISL-46]MBT2741494.1 flavodoxin domain-containing protein [Bacillus sp. ISL-77]